MISFMLCHQASKGQAMGVFSLCLILLLAATFSLLFCKIASGKMLATASMHWRNSKKILKCSYTFFCFCAEGRQISLRKGLGSTRKLLSCQTWLMVLWIMSSEWIWISESRSYSATTHKRHLSDRLEVNKQLTNMIQYYGSTFLGPVKTH
jgi:hypothetical protein